MKKIIFAVLFAAAGTMVMAGGDLMPSSCADNARKSCKEGGVYVDYKTNLMWQDEPYGDVEDGAYKNNRSAGKAGRWRYAKSYCSNLVYAGFDDWRLPKIGELVKLYDEKLMLKNTIDVDFWSSTPSKGNKYWALFSVINGQPYEHKASDSHYIRCVRCVE